jgi:hypothetical protein
VTTMLPCAAVITLVTKNEKDTARTPACRPSRWLLCALACPHEHDVATRRPSVTQLQRLALTDCSGALARSDRRPVVQFDAWAGEG